MNNEEKFKNKVKNLLDEPNYAYDADNWETASKHLDAEDKKRRRFFYFLFSGLGLILILSTILFYYPFKNNNNIKAIHTKEIIHSNPTNDSLPKENKTEKNQITSGKVSQTPATGGNLDSEKDSNTKPNSASVEQPVIPADQEPGQSSVSYTKVTKNGSTNQVASAVTPNEETKAASDPEIKIVFSKVSDNSGNHPTPAKPNDPGKPDQVTTNSTGKPGLTAQAFTSKLNPNDSLVNLNDSSKENKNPMAVSAIENSVPPSTNPVDSIAKNIPVTQSPDTLINSISQPTLQNLAINNYFFVEAGAYFNMGWSYHGSREGMGIDPYLGLSYLSKLNDKLSFTFGAYYSSLSHLKYDTKVIKNTVVVFGEESNVTAITPQKVNYFLVPLKMQYALKENQAFTAGCTIGYLLDVQSQVETYMENYNGKQDYTIYHTGGYVEGFKTFNTQLSIGYRRRLYKNLWLNSEVLAGLSDIRENTFFGMTLSERLTGLKISLSYDLIKK